MKKDVVEEAETSYDEKYRLLKKAKATDGRKLVLELRRKTYGVRWYTVTAGFSGMAFITGFFANRYFNKLCKKHNLEVEKNE